MGGERPLQGRRIAVTRPRGQAEPLARELERWGAEAILSPTIRIADREGGELHRAVASLDEFDWVVFTSANGVRAVWDALEEMGSAGRLPRRMRVAAIGPATARALERRGVDAEIVPEEYVAEAVAEALTRGGDISGLRILLPRAAGARKVLPERLEAAGARVEEVAAYEAVADEEGIGKLSAAVGRGEVDMVTFTAASTVRHYVERAGPRLGRARVAAIGPITAQAARELGLAVDVEAREYTVDGLVAAIVEYYAKTEGEG